MPALTVHDLHKSFGTRTVFGGVSFVVQPGEKVGFIGANGSGKSTLFRIVAGEEGYEGGTISCQRGMAAGHLPQEPAFVEEDTILRAVAAGRPALLEVLSDYHEVAGRLARGEGDADRLLARQGETMERIRTLGGWDHEHRLEAILTRLGVADWDRRMASLSGGERKRVALARVLVQQPDLLLLDEPTNHLDADTTRWLEGYLLDYPGALMLVTHDRYFLDRVVTRMIEVSRGDLTAYAGGYTEYLEAKAERRARAEEEEKKRARLIERELAWVKRAPAARTGKQKARISRLARTRREHRESLPPGREGVEMRFGTPPRLGRTVVDLRDIAKSYDGGTLIRDFSALLRAGERIGIVGPNGAGKTTLLRIVLGEQAPDAGEVIRGRNTRIAYYDQERADLDPEASLLASVAEGDWVEVAGKQTHVRTFLQDFLFPPGIHDQKVSSLSGGERNRLLLARLLLQDANLLILDEPTNDLDLPTLQVLEEALVDFPGCVLVVTHDRYFLDKVATGLFVFEGDGRVHRHEGGYDLYRRRRAEQERRSTGPDGPRPPRRQGAPRTAPAPERRGKLSYREQQELKGMEEEILAAEAERGRLGELLADPALYTESPHQVAGLSSAFEEAGKRVEELYARWAELEAIRESS